MSKKFLHWVDVHDVFAASDRSLWPESVIAVEVNWSGVDIYVTENSSIDYSWIQKVVDVTILPHTEMIEVVGMSLPVSYWEHGSFPNPPRPAAHERPHRIFRVPAPAIELPKLPVPVSYLFADNISKDPMWSGTPGLFVDACLEDPFPRFGEAEPVLSFHDFLVMVHALGADDACKYAASMLPRDQLVFLPAFRKHNDVGEIFPNHAENIVDALSLLAKTLGLSQVVVYVSPGKTNTNEPFVLDPRVQNLE